MGVQLFPHIKYVVDKFKHKLPKDDLKRYAKDVGAFVSGHRSTANSRCR